MQFKMIEISGGVKSPLQTARLPLISCMHTEITASTSRM
jgi:hypothetical protein